MIVTKVGSDDSRVIVSSRLLYSYGSFPSRVPQFRRTWTHRESRIDRLIDSIWCDLTRKIRRVKSTSGALANCISGARVKYTRFFSSKHSINIQISTDLHRDSRKGGAEAATTKFEVKASWRLAINPSPSCKANTEASNIFFFWAARSRRASRGSLNDCLEVFFINSANSSTLLLKS